MARLNKVTDAFAAVRQQAGTPSTAKGSTTRVCVDLEAGDIARLRQAAEAEGRSLRAHVRWLLTHLDDTTG